MMVICLDTVFKLLFSPKSEDFYACPIILRATINFSKMHLFAY